MASKFKFKINEETTLTDALNALEEAASSRGTEIPFNFICKIMEFIGAELQHNNTGSLRRFKHPLCKNTGQYLGVHVMHGNKTDVKVNILDFKNHFMNDARKLIAAILDSGKH